MTSLQLQWHAVSFKIRMLNDSHEYKTINQADSPLHSLIANEILGPIIERLEEDIVVYRFHRTFNQAEKSHPFRLKLYGPLSLGSAVGEYIQRHGLYQEVKALGLLELMENEDIACQAVNGETQMKDDNDSSWPDEIKEVWPCYIHGVSRAWLGLVRLFADKEKEKVPHVTFKQKIDLYTKVNGLVAERWISCGCPAMLHHLNAVFGYKHIQVNLEWHQVRSIAQVLFQNNRPGYLASINF